MSLAKWRHGRAVLALVLLLGGLWEGAPALSAQAASPQPSAGSAAGDTTPKPYSADEFPDWLQTLRRFEIIAIGSFPLSYMDVNMVYDIGRYAYKWFKGDADANNYAPLFFAPANKPAYTQDETNGIIWTSVGVALAVAVLDLILGAVEQSEAEARFKAAAPTGMQSAGALGDDGWLFPAVPGLTPPGASGSEGLERYLNPAFGFGGSSAETGAPAGDAGGGA